MSFLVCVRYNSIVDTFYFWCNLTISIYIVISSFRQWQCFIFYFLLETYARYCVSSTQFHIFLRFVRRLLAWCFREYGHRGAVSAGVVRGEAPHQFSFSQMDKFMNNFIFFLKVAKFTWKSCFLTTDLQTPPLKSDHLDIIDPQWAKKMMGVKLHTKSYRVWTPRASKGEVLGAQKFNFLQKWPNLQGRLELIWR